MVILEVQTHVDSAMVSNAEAGSCVAKTQGPYGCFPEHNEMRPHAKSSYPKLPDLTKSVMKLDLLLPKFKLYDFDDRRGGELARLIFKVANVPYEDISVNRGEQWEAIKNETPLGTLPVLEMDEMKLSGQMAICRQLGWRFGLSGQSAASDSLLDMFADLLFEAHILLFGSTDDEHDSNANFITADETKLEKVSSRVASSIEKQLSCNNTTYLIGERLTWVDLMTYAFFNVLLEHGKNTILDGYPSTKRMCEKISQINESFDKSEQQKVVNGVVDSKTSV